jgi:His-Xaa-Ser system protein HxsD
VWQVSFDSQSVDPSSIKRAAYKFTDQCSADLQISEEKIVCVFDFKNEVSEEEFRDFSIEFRNEVLDEGLRAEISAQTEPVRNLILAYAFSNAGLENGG